MAKRRAYELAAENKAAKTFLNKNLIFKRVQKGALLFLSSFKDPLSKLSLREGTKSSKTLSRFLRHGMNVAQYCEIDGSIELDLAVAVNLAFEQNKKRRFLV